MSIEFACSQCGKLLRVGDDAAGKHARCPNCSAVQAVPGPPEPVSPFAPALPPSPGAAELNPYQAPVSAPWYGEASRVGSFQPTVIDAGEVLDRTWSIFKEQFAAVLAGAFIYCVCGVSCSFMITLAEHGVRARGQPAEALGAQAFAVVIRFCFHTWLQAGMATYMLKIARGDPASLADLFSGGRVWSKAVVARFVFSMVIIVGLILFVIPGVFAALTFSQYLYVIIDRGEGPIESLGTSRTLTIGNKLSVFLLGLTTVAISLLGFAACCVGIIPAVGFIALMWAVTYLSMTGQPIADQLESRTTQPVVEPGADLR